MHSSAADTMGLLQANWDVPDVVKTVVSTRSGGVSTAPYVSLNLANHVGDRDASVVENRLRLQAFIDTPYQPQWLNQVHGTEVVEAVPDRGAVTADAVVTSIPGLPCAVLTADCLPVFLCSAEGDRVGAAHAGWRGLAAGVLEQTITAMDRRPQDLVAWLGPAIGPAHFEVGPEIREAFVKNSEEFQCGFTASDLRSGHWYADIYRLAAVCLQMRGVEHISGGGFCTFTDQDRFFSYRRDGVTGRMASLIWIDAGSP